jgi:hypothetical protein
MIESLALALATLLGILAAAVAHELTHMLVALPVAEAAEYRLPEHHVDIYVRDESWREHWVAVAGVSPALVGSLALLLGLQLGVAVPLTLAPASLAFWAIWFVYSVGGGWTDYIPSRARGDVAAADD